MMAVCKEPALAERRYNASVLRVADPRSGARLCEEQRAGSKTAGPGRGGHALHCAVVAWVDGSVPNDSQHNSLFTLLFCKEVYRRSLWQIFVAKDLLDDFDAVLTVEQKQIDIRILCPECASK